MQITFSQLKKLSVYTKSGVYLGKVADLVLAADGMLVLQLTVRSHKIAGRTLLINNSQVREITPEKIIVEDAAVIGAVSVRPVSASGLI